MDESEGEDDRGPEGSDFAAEESYEKVTRMRKRVTRSMRNAEEGYEDVWDEVQEALSAMEHEEFDATAEAEQGLKRRDPLQQHHPKRQCGLRMCLVYLYLLVSMCTTPSVSSEDF